MGVKDNHLNLERSMIMGGECAVLVKIGVWTSDVL